MQQQASVHDEIRLAYDRFNGAALAAYGEAGAFPLGALFADDAWVFGWQGQASGRDSIITFLGGAIERSKKESVAGDLVEVGIETRMLHINTIDEENAYALALQEVHLRGSESASVEMRASFIWRKIGGVWMITHMHSSRPH